MRAKIEMSKVILYAMGRGYVLAVVSAWLTFWYTSKLWRVLAAVWLDDEAMAGIVDPDK